MSRALAHWRRVMLMKRKAAGAVAALRRIQSWQHPLRSASVMAANITLAFCPQARSQPKPQEGRHVYVWKSAILR